MKPDKPRMRLEQARLGAFIAIGFAFIAVLAMFFLPGLSVIAWIVIGVSLFTVFGELLTIAKIKRNS